MRRKIGKENLKSADSKIIRKPEACFFENESPDKPYLIILTSSGVVTFAFYLLFIVALIRVTRGTVISLCQRNQSEMMMGLVFLASTVMFSVKILNSGEESLHYWMFFSLAAAWTRNCSRELPEATAIA